MIIVAWGPASIRTFLSHHSSERWLGDLVNPAALHGESCPPTFGRLLPSQYICPKQEEGSNPPSLNFGSRSNSVSPSTSPCLPRQHHSFWSILTRPQTGAISFLAFHSTFKHLRRLLRAETRPRSFGFTSGPRGISFHPALASLVAVTDVDVPFQDRPAHSTTPSTESAAGGC